MNKCILTVLLTFILDTVVIGTLGLILIANGLSTKLLPLFAFPIGFCIGGIAREITDRLK